MPGVWTIADRPWQTGDSPPESSPPPASGPQQGDSSASARSNFRGTASGLYHPADSPVKPTCCNKIDLLFWFLYSAFDSRPRRVYREVGIHGGSGRKRLTMGSFGEDLRMERLSRGIRLEQITAVTKIQSRHLEALENEQFRLLPGGILSKGIIRSYAAALGLDENLWTERFLRASNAAGEVEEGDDGWAEFASNVGKARILRHDSREVRLRWLGATLFLLLVLAAAYFALRYYGLHANWWTTLVPVGGVHGWLDTLLRPFRH